MATLSEFSSNLESLVAAARERIVSVGAGKTTPRSGLILKGGEIVTVARSAERGESVPVHLGEQEHTAEVMGFDPASGIALLHCSDFEGQDLGANAMPGVGSLSVTVASPIPGDYEARLGMIRCVGGETRMPGGRRIGAYFQTDSQRFRGFAGSVVFAPDGAVLGLTIPVNRREEGFVLPASELQTVVGQLREGKNLGTGYLGIQATAVDLPESVDGFESGLLVTGVEPDSPAERAGLQVGNFVVRVGEQLTPDIESLYDSLAGMKEGAEIEIGVVGQGEGIKNMKAKVTLRK